MPNTNASISDYSDFIERLKGSIFEEHQELAELFVQALIDSDQGLLVNLADKLGTEIVVSPKSCIKLAIAKKNGNAYDVNFLINELSADMTCGKNAKGKK